MLMERREASKDPLASAIFKSLLSSDEEDLLVLCIQGYIESYVDHALDRVKRRRRRLNRRLGEPDWKEVKKLLAMTDRLLPNWTIVDEDTFIPMSKYYDAKSIGAPFE